MLSVFCQDVHQYIQRDVIPSKYYPATLLILVINVVLYFVAHPVYTTWNVHAEEAYAFAAQHPVLWQLIAPFLHANLAHIYRNMAMLIPCLILIERRVGALHTFLFYLVSGFLAGLLCLHMYGPQAIGIGASGVVFAVMALSIIVYCKGIARLLLLPGLVFFMTEIAVWWMPDGIGHVAHFGGYMVGLLWGLVLLPEYGVKRCRCMPLQE